MYTVVYDYKGLPQSILRVDSNGYLSVPICALNSDFVRFLEWNAKQEVPLDYQTPIVPEKSPNEIKQEQAKAEVKALKDKLIQGQKLTDKERAEVIDSLIQLLG